MEFLSVAEVMQKVKLSRTTLWRLERTGQFPARRVIGLTKIGWLADEVHQWMKERPTAGNAYRSEPE